MKALIIRAMLYNKGVLIIPANINTQAAAK